MKKIILTIAALALTSLSAGAQTIQKGNKFFDGEMLWTAEVTAPGELLMRGTNGTGRAWVFYLEKQNQKPGMYRLVRRGHTLIPAFNTEWDADVQYVRQQGMNFLAVSDGKGNVAELLTLTPDNIENCKAQQQFASEQIIWETMGDLFLNTHLLESHDLGGDGLFKLAAILRQKTNPSVIERWNLKLVDGYILANYPEYSPAAQQRADIIGWVNTMYADVVRRNTAEDIMGATEELEQKYLAIEFRQLIERTREADAKVDGIGFFDHDYWTMSQDPSGDFHIQNVTVDEVFSDGAGANVSLDVLPFKDSEPTRITLRILPDGDGYRILDIIDHHPLFGEGGFDYSEKMQQYLSE